MLITIEYDIDNLNLENILTIVYDKFEEMGEVLDLRSVTTKIEFILKTKLDDLDKLFKQIDFINILFKRNCTITVNTNNLHSMSYHNISQFNNKNIKYIDFIIENIELFNGYDFYRTKVNYMDLSEFNINVNIYSEYITPLANEKTHYIISTSLDNIRTGKLITRVL